MINIFARFFELLVEMLGLIPYFLSGFIKKDKNLWVFGAWKGDSYSDNSRYLFEYVSSTRKSIQAVWITRSHRVLWEVRKCGLIAYMSYSPQGMWACMRAKVCFITHDRKDVFAYGLRRANVIYLTHGTPLKKLGRDKRSKRFGRLTHLFDRWVREILPSYRPSDFVFVASTYAVERFANATGISKHKIMASGYPRWGPLLSPGSFSKKDKLRRELTAYGLVMMYAPTHRNEGRSQLCVTEISGMSAFVDWLKRENAVLIIRPHRSLQFKDMEVLEAACGDHARLISQEEFADTSSLLPDVDILMSDYSSIIFDYAVLHRPIVLFAHDLEQYEKYDQGMYGDYRSEFDGMIASDWFDVVNRLDAINSIQSKMAYDRFYEIHGELSDGAACRRIADTFS